MAIYETIVIFDSLMPPKDIDTAVERLTSIIESNKGVVRKIDKWGKKRLAYEIEKKQYGFYVAIEFGGTGNIPRELESDYNYSDKVLRYLTYRYERHQLKQMELDQAGPAKSEQKPKTAATGNNPVPAPPAVETAEVQQEESSVEPKADTEEDNKE